MHSRRSPAVPWLLALLTLLAVVAGPGPQLAHADEQRAYTKTIVDEASWQRYSKRLGSDQLGKFIIDVSSNDLYFIDVNLFNIHADFVLGVLLKLPWTAENVREYNRNYELVKPRFILGYLTHHLKVDQWTMSFWEGDKLDAATVLRARKRLEGSFFRSKELRFRPDSPRQESLMPAVTRGGLTCISNNDIYQAAEYQAFNNGRAVGTLRIVKKGTPFESLTFDRHDIVVLQESYPDITPVAGILASSFSTPLSHVNLRATAWKIPNAGDKKAFDKYATLDGKVVYFEVADTGAILRLATAAEITELRDRVEAARHVDMPAANLTSPRLAMLTRMRAKDVSMYGTKAANLGEIVTANLGVNVPEGFGVPFFYYVRHLRQNGLDTSINAMLGDKRFATDAAWRRAELEKLRAAIVAAPIDEAVLDMLYKRVRLKLGGAGVFVRSSTNAEDLPGFNGAGLYDTVANVVGRKALGEALRTVWASLWNLRAVEERSAFGIDHREVYVAVLVQVGVKATASGVLVTTNLWDRSDDDGFTINAKWGLGMRVVEGQRIPEQIIFDSTNDGTKIISRSDDPVMLIFDEKGGILEVPSPAGGGVILSEERAKRLVNAVQLFMPLFAAKVLDVEWVLEGETVWIVQARPYVGA